MRLMRVCGHAIHCFMTRLELHTLNTLQQPTCAEMTCSPLYSRVFQTVRVLARSSPGGCALPVMQDAEVYLWVCLKL